MADPETPPAESSPARAPEGDALLRIQANIYDFVARNWQYGAGVAGVIVVVALGYGAWHSFEESRRDDHFGLIAAVDYRMPKASEMAAYGLAPPYDPNDAAVMSDLEIGAQKYREAGEASAGAARAIAFLKEAQVWQWRGDPAKELEALERAVAVGAKDLVGFSAESALVDALLRADRTEEAGGRATGMTTRYTGALGEESWLILIRAQLQAGKTAEAVASMKAWRAAYPSSTLSTETAASIAVLRDGLVGSPAPAPTPASPPASGTGG